MGPRREPWENGIVKEWRSGERTRRPGVVQLESSAAFMHARTDNFALLIVTVGLTGCLREFRYTSAPGASGRVIDSFDHSPISDAIVTLIPDEIGPYSEKNKPVEARTSRHGIFQIPEQTDWLVYDVRSPAAHIGFWAPALLRVQHPGYQPFETNITINLTERSQGTTGIDCFKAGDICLKKVPE